MRENLRSKLSFANSLVAPADQNSAAQPSLAAEAPINAAIATLPEPLEKAA